MEAEDIKAPTSNKGDSFGTPFFVNFLQRYAPAQGLDDATMLLSTEEIAEKIARHTGVMPVPSELYTWLWNNGFRDVDRGDMRYEWMMKEME